MKKLIIVFLLTLFLPVQALALQIYSDYSVTASLYKIKQLPPYSVFPQADNTITAEHGINLLIDRNAKVLLEKRDALYISGTAVDNGKISAEVTPVYAEDYKSVHFPVLADLTDGEDFIISDLHIRAYDRFTAGISVDLDVNGDMIVDESDVNTFRVTDTSSVVDIAKPYPPTNFQYIHYPEAKKVHLSWVNPPDYDLEWMTLDRTLVRDGQTTNRVLFTKFLFTEYDDTNIQVGDQITYKLYGSDKRNLGEIALLEVELTPPAPEPPPEDPTEPPAEEPELEGELADLSRLFNYYNVRYQIKCLAATASPDGDLCRWARIHLVYAQEKLGRFDVDTEITDHDKYIMAKRVRWPEMRYQTKCVEAETPDKTCTALEQSLERIHYFIDNE